MDYVLLGFFIQLVVMYGVILASDFKNYSMPKLLSKRAMNDALTQAAVKDPAEASPFRKAS